MSRSPSSTPTPNPSNPSEATDTQHSFDLFATSRESHEHSPAEASRQTRAPARQPVSTTADAKPRAESSQSVSGGRGGKRTRAESEELPGGVTRRPRMSSPSGSSSNSQADLADTEHEGGRNERSERSTSDTLPLKKKRTRTLTTPHQSAVLHALLAQSRFPTTAMREEVGRQIGLSARKVQIWFQNQRQKAKRPRSQGATPVARPPQYGPFPNVPGAPSASVGNSASFLTFGTARPEPGGMSPQEAAPSSASSAGSEQSSQRFAVESPFLGLGSQLSGPGIPGPAFPSISPIRGGETASRHRRSSRLSQSLDSTPYFLQSSLHYSGRPVSRHPISVPAPVPDREHPYPIDPSLTLPPLTFDRPPSHLPRTMPPGYPLSRFERLPSSAPSTMTSFDFARTTSTHDPPFAHVPPDVPGPSLSIIPPPFALQPAPQWDPDTFSPLSRPGSSSVSRPGSSYYYTEGRTSPLDTSSQQPSIHTAPGQPVARDEGSSNGESTPQPPLRSTRFDPVRSSALSYTSVPTPETPSSPTARSHERPADDSPPE